MMSKEKKQEYIKDMTSQFDNSEAVIVTHYQGLTVSQLDELRKKMREHGIKFKITNNFTPAGDQPIAIDQLKKGLKNLDRSQVLLGVTGSGKTFTMAKIIEDLNRPALILAPNKTLAAQLYGEMKNFFSKNNWRKIRFLQSPL